MPKDKSKGKRNSQLSLVKLITEIESLENDIHLLVKQINNPYSSLVTILIFPTVFTLLFLREYSPLHLFYQKLVNVYADKFREIVSNEAIPLDKHVDGIIKNSQHYIAKLEQLRNLPEINPLKENIPIEDLLEKFDAMDYSKQLDTTRKNMITLFNQIIYQYNKDALLSEENYYSFAFLYKSLKSALPVYSEYLRPKIKDLTEGVITVRVDFETNKYIVIGKIFLALLGKPLIIDPLFNRFFPNGVFQASKPKPNKPLNFLVPDEAQQIIIDLKKHKNNLQVSARKSITLARLCMIIILPIAINYLWNLSSINYPSAEIVIFVISLVGVALTNLLQEINDCYKTISLTKKLNQIEQKLESAFMELPVTFELYRGQTLDSSYAILTCDRYNKAISEVHLTRVIKDVLVLSGANITKHGKKQLTMAIQNFINFQLFSKLLNEFLQRASQIRQLKQQLLKFTKNGDVLFFDQRDEKNLPILHCKIIFDEEIVDKHLIESMEVLYAKDNKLTMKASKGYYKVDLVGYQEADEIKLNDVLKKQAKINLSHETFAIEPYSEATVIRPLKKNKVTKLNEVKSLPIITTKPILAGIIVWPSASYNTNQAENTVIPINSPMLKQDKYFVTSKLAEPDFPDEESFKKFSDVIAMAKIVPGKGNQGLVFASGFEKDSKSKSVFFSNMKAKFLGKYGDMRAYASQERSATGEVLYVFRSLKMHTH